MAADAPRAALDTELRQLLARTAAPGAAWGIHVVSLKSGRTLFETNAHRLFVPASNTKLFTAALALDRLGTNHQLTTLLRLPARTNSAATNTPVIRGDLLLVGGGDPTITDRFNGGNWQKALAPLVESVVAAGIQRIEGDLVCDTSLLRSAPFGPGWNWDDLEHPYGAAVSALSLNDNVVHLRFTPGATSGAPVIARQEPIPDWLIIHNDVVTGPSNATADLRIERAPGDNNVFVTGVLPAGGAPQTEDVTVPSPALYFGDLFKLALSQRGVAVTGPVREIGWRERQQRPLVATNWQTIAELKSPHMSDLVRVMMKPSQNLYAHLLWLLTGVETEQAPRPEEQDWPKGGPADAGSSRAFRAFLKRTGIPPTAVVLEEGSGLSRKNLLSPAATTQLLAYMDRHPARDAWHASLPIGGVDGTLLNRFTKSPAKGNVRAKTGTLRNIVALSGYVTTAAGERLAFSVLVNNYVPTNSAASARAEVDALVELLARWNGPMAPEPQ
jgi:D-alanyl-D-alanine carboxypeptidase/D-alanyl-D-alanine-endopeptidase (penicillin-binding protein 4)